MATVDEIKIVVTAVVDEAMAKMKALDNVNKQNTKTGLDLAKSIAGYTTGFGLAVQAGQALIRGTAELIKQSITLAASVERIKMEFTVLTGSQEASNKLFAEMNALAAQTPLELSDITAAGKQLLSVGIPMDQIVGKLRMLGDVAMGNPEKLQRLTEAFGQLKSKGVASMEQLNRFIEAGVPIMAELQKQTGKSGDEVFKMVSQGKIGFNEVTKALESLTSSGGLMDGMMAKVAETAEGKLSTAMDNWKMTLVDIGTKMLPLVTRGLESVTQTLSDLSLVGTIGDIVSGKVKDYATITAAFNRAQEIINNPQSTTLGWLNVAKIRGQFDELAKLQNGARVAEELRAKAMAGSAAIQEQNAKNAAAAEKERLDKIERLSTAYSNYAHYRLSIEPDITKKADEAAAAFHELANQYDLLASMSTPFDDIKDPEVLDTIDRIKEGYSDLGATIREENKQAGATFEDLTKKQLDFISIIRDSTMSMAEQFGEALVTDSTEGWKAFGRAGLNSIAALIEAFGKMWAAEAFADWFIPGMQASAIGLGIAAASAYTAAGMVKAIPLAEGGIVQPRAGGTLALLGEAGKAEAVVPLDGKNRFGGTTVIQNYYIGGSILTERQVASLGMAKMVKAGRGW